MAWLRSHSELRQHPKTRKLARRVGGLPNAVGHLHLLWWFAMDYAPDGDLSRYSDEEIADAGEWSGDPAEFVSALSDSGFLDNGAIHDWYDHAGRYVDQRITERKRSAARRSTAGRPQDDQRSTVGRREEKRREEKKKETRPDKPAAVDKSLEEDFEGWWAASGKIGSKADARVLYIYWRVIMGASRDDLLTAVVRYHRHCLDSGAIQQHGRTFLAKKDKEGNPVNRWQEWLDPTAHAPAKGNGKPSAPRKQQCECGCNLTPDESGRLTCPECEIGVTT